MLQVKRKEIWSFFNSLLFCLALQAFVLKSISFWSLEGPLLPINPTAALIIAVLALLIHFVLRLKVTPWPFISWLWVVFLSDWIDRPYNFFQGTDSRGVVILFSLLTLMLVKKRKWQMLNVLPIIAIIICAFSFLSQSGGKLLFMDDHTVFQFRLAMLKDNFPNIPFYYPLWNAGFDSRDFFATGCLSVFTIFSPLIYAFPIEKIYNLIIILLFFIIHPFLIFSAAKLARIPSPGPAISATLSLSLSLTWYRWALQYGTLGFITSCAFMPLNLVILSRILDEKETFDSKMAALFVVTFSLMLFWSISGFVFIPAIVLGLIKIKHVLFKKNVIPAAIFVLIINIPWMITFWTVSNVAKFVSDSGSNHNQVVVEEELRREVEKKGALNMSLEVYYKKALKVVRENIIPINPVLLTLGIVGLVLYFPAANRLFLLTGIWLFLVTLVISPLFPRLELDRMLVLLSALLTLPTARTIVQLFKDSESETEYAKVKRVLASLAGGFLIASPFISGSIISNRSLMHYYFENEEVDEMSRLIKEHSRGGRIMYAGFVLHELSNGHLAPLTYRTNLPLVASSHVHNMWKYTDVIPPHFKKLGNEGIESFYDLYNVSALFAHEKGWIQFFRERPEFYEEIGKSGKFVLFKRINFKNTFIIEGQGELASENSNSLTIKAKTKNLVISFIYFDFLRASACEIKPKFYDDNLKFISLENCPLDTPITVDSVPVYSRVGRRLL